MKELRSQRQVMDGFSYPEHETDLSRDCKRMMAWKKKMGMREKNDGFMGPVEADHPQ